MIGVTSRVGWSRCAGFGNLQYLWEPRFYINRTNRAYCFVRITGFRTAMLRNSHAGACPVER